MQWTQVLYAEVPVFHGKWGPKGGQNRVILGSKSGHLWAVRGWLGPWGPGVSLIYRETGSGKLCLTVVNHPPDSVFGGHSVTIFGDFSSKKTDFWSKKGHFLNVIDLRRWGGKKVSFFAKKWDFRPFSSFPRGVPGKNQKSPNLYWVFH